MNVQQNIEEFKYAQNPEQSKLRGKELRKVMAALITQFKADLEKQFQVQDNPKKDKLWDLAWEYGHSYDLTEFFHYYNDMVELIR